MPNRILKDSICTSDNLDKLTPAEEVFWYRLLVQCDDYGRMDARPAIIRSRCYPLRLDTVSNHDVSAWMDALIAAELITIYENDGKQYLQVVTWASHQQQRAKRSKYPAPDVNSASANIGNQMITDAPVIQSNPNPNPNRESESESNAPAAQDADPARRAVCNAYDASGLMMSKTHLDFHLETIKRTGLPAWQLGFAAALAAGKPNVPKYVARCAESVMLAEQVPRNGHGNGRHAEPESNQEKLTRVFASLNSEGATDGNRN